MLSEAKKANADWVERCLSDKAEFADLNDVRARLERPLISGPSRLRLRVRLEVLVAHNDQKTSSKLQAMREDTAASKEDMVQRLVFRQ